MVGVAGQGGGVPGGRQLPFPQAFAEHADAVADVRNLGLAVGLVVEGRHLGEVPVQLPGALRSRPASSRRSSRARTTELVVRLGVVRVGGEDPVEPVEGQVGPPLDQVELGAPEVQPGVVGRRGQAGVEGLRDALLVAPVRQAGDQQDESFRLRDAPPGRIELALRLLVRPSRSGPRPARSGRGADSGRGGGSSGRPPGPPRG